jgi:hypothetical protein
MPLAQLVQQPAAAVVPAAKREARRPRAPQQQDVCSLLVRVLLRLFRGEVLSLETVKAAWRELSFSFVFEVMAPKLAAGLGPRSPTCTAARGLPQP